MSPKKPLESLLEQAAPDSLTESERQHLVRAVMARTARSIPSPYSFISTRSMIPLAIALIVLLGAGGTVAASDSARPGDFLFPLDRGIEEVRLALAPNEDKDTLRIRFAEERIKEFDAIVDTEAGATELSGPLTEAEATIFTNETLVKLEAGDTKVFFKTNATTREALVTEIASLYGFSEAEVDAVLVIETEDRESRATDRGNSEDAKLRIEHAISVLSAFAERTRSQASTSPGVLNALERLEARLESRVEGREELRSKSDDNKTRIELRNEEGKVRIEVREDEVRIKSDSKDGSDEDRSSDRSSSDTKLEIEADVFTDSTVVKVEQNDQKTTFTTSATTRAAIIAEILTRYPFLVSSEVDAALDLEVEDKESKEDSSGSGH